MISRVLLVSFLLILIVFPSLAMALVDTTEEDKLMNDVRQYIETSRKGTTQLQVVDDTTGKPVARTQVLYQQKSHDFIFSTMTWGTGGSTAPYSQIRYLGLEWNAITTLSWARIEPVKGQYNYSELDRIIATQRQNIAMRIWGQFQDLVTSWNCIGNPGCSITPPSYADIDHLNDPAVFAQYKDLVNDFVFNVATHFKGTLQGYRTMIETNWPDDVITLHLANHRQWTVDQAVELDKVVTSAIRRADPNAVIMLGLSTAGYGSSGSKSANTDALTFAKMLTQAGVDADMWALEAYPFDGSPAFFYTYIKHLASLGKTVFIHETGYPSAQFASCEAMKCTNWKWSTFDEQTQALWFKYLFVIVFGMKEATGVSLNVIREPPINQFSATVTSVFDSTGVYTRDWKPKMASVVVHNLTQLWTSSGRATTDDNGIANIQGFAGDYAVNVTGYNPVSIKMHVSEGKTSSFTVKVVSSKPAVSTSAVVVATSQVSSTISSATSQVASISSTGYLMYAGVAGAIVAVALLGLMVIRRQRKRKTST